MPPDDFWSPGPPRRRRRADEPDPEGQPTSPAAPQSFPTGPQSFPGGPRYAGPPGPQGPPTGQYPQGPPPGYPDQPWRDPSPAAGAPGPQSFATGPVYPGATPPYRPAGAPPGAAPPGAANGQHHPPPPFEPPAERGPAPWPERSGPPPLGQPAYGPSQPYGRPVSPPTPYGQGPGYPPPAAPGYGGAGYGDPGFGDAGYGPGPYDSATTQVFEPGPFVGGPYGGDQFGNAHTAATGPIPAFDEDFGRSATARIDFGPREAFGPPPSNEPERAPDDAHLFTRLRRIRSHAQQRRSKRWIAVLLVILVVGAAAAVRFAPMSPWRKGGSDTGSVGTTMPFHQAQFTAEDLGSEGFLSWAYEDVTTGNVVGSANLDQASDATSMLAVWIAADYLRKAAAGQGPSDGDKADIEAMIRDDDAAAADRIVAKLGDSQEWIGQLRSMCALTDVKPAGTSWRTTEITARDAARLGACLANNTAAGAQWTPWLLSEMRQVRGSGDFGIREAFPAKERPSIAIKNGVAFVDADGQWRANCLAVTPSWSLAVLQRYPKHGDANTDLAHVDVVCQQVVFRLTGTNP